MKSTANNPAARQGADPDPDRRCGGSPTGGPKPSAAARVPAPSDQAPDAVTGNVTDLSRVFSPSAPFAGMAADAVSDCAAARISDPDDTEARIALLARCVTPRRLAAFERTAAMRTFRMTVLAENTYHGQNAAALVRHCEAFGIQRMHTVESVCPFRPSADVVRGTDKWVDIVRHATTAGALAALRGEGCRIVATTPHRRSCTPGSFDVAGGPFALVFGTEHAGISPEVAEVADEFLSIPMCGMVESLNVSACAAIVICRLAERLRAQDDRWRLTRPQQRALVLRWLRSSVRSADEILRRAGFDCDR